MLDAATIHSADVLRGSPKFDRQNFFVFEAPPLVDLEKNVLRSACIFESHRNVRCFRLEPCDVPTMVCLCSQCVSNATRAAVRTARGVTRA
jgi:hypothetical protein